jgi:hypothetical protein
MERPRIDITEDLDGEHVVHACFDLDHGEIAASAHALAVTAPERFRTSSMSGDDVVELRELTALADEFGELVRGQASHTLVMRPARLSAYRDAVARFVETRDTAEWVRGEDREALGRLRDLLPQLDQLCGEAMRAALSPSPSPRVG